MQATPETPSQTPLNLPVSFAQARVIVEDTLERVVPGYASLSGREKEAWRTRNSDGQSRWKDEVLDAILVEHTPITLDRLQQTKGLMSSRELVDEMGEEGREFRNLCALALDGIGEDWFVLNEYMPDDHSLADYHTVGAWDREQHARQITGMQQDQMDPDKIAQHAAYTGNLYAEWGRIAQDDRLTYLTLHTLAHYLASVAETHGDDIIHDILPYRFVKNADHGKDMGYGSKLWSMRTDAGGKEDILEAVKRAHTDGLHARTIALRRRFAEEQMGVVWIVETPKEDLIDPNERHRTVIFSDPQAMDNVRWTSFLSDSHAVAGDPDVLARLVSEEKALVARTIEEAYQKAQAIYPEAARLDSYTPPPCEDDDLFAPPPA